MLAGERDKLLAQVERYESEVKSLREAWSKKEAEYETEMRERGSEYEVLMKKEEERVSLMMKEVKKE